MKKICTKCKVQKSVLGFYKHRLKNNGDISYMAKCIECTKEEKKLQMRAYRKANPLKFRIRQRKWSSENKEKYLEIAKKGRDNLRNQILSYYSKGKIRCACCKESCVRMLTLDHINNKGGEERKKHGKGHRYFASIIRRNYPTGYQVLCLNCNLGKNYNKGICPHKEVISKPTRS